MTEDRFYARSASDRTDDWPAWFIADRAKGNQNVSAEMIREHVDPAHGGGVFLPRELAVFLALVANGKASFTVEVPTK